VGLATIIKADLGERLLTGLELADVENVGLLSAADLKFVFRAINNTCDFFGDVKMTHDMLEELVESVFASNSASLQDGELLKYRDHVAEFVDHPMVEAFLNMQSSGDGSL